MILRLHTAARHSRRHGRVVENGRQIEAASLPVIDGGLYIEHVYAADHFVHAAEAQLRHILTHLLRQKEKEVNDVFGLPLKLLAQCWILRGDSDRTSIQMALAHHDATHRNERRCGESKFFCSKQRSDGYVSTSLEFAVGLHPNSTAQIA